MNRYASKLDYAVSVIENQNNFDLRQKCIKTIVNEISLYDLTISKINTACTQLHVDNKILELFQQVFSSLRGNTYCVGLPKITLLGHL